MTERDRELLRFIAAQRFVLSCHARVWFGGGRTVGYRRLASLVEAGLLSYRRIFHGEPGVYTATNGGLAIADSPLPRAKVDLRTYRHDVGAVWLWLHAHRGRLGCAERVFTERELRHHHYRLPVGVQDDGFGVQVDGYDRAGRPRVHHPDVLVRLRAGGLVAVELELSVKARPRLESIMLGYAISRGLARVIYLTDSPAVQRALATVISGYGLDALVRVHYVEAEHSGEPWWMWRSLDRVWEETGR